MSRPDSVLALDIATTTGWCVGVPGTAPMMGSIRLMGRGVEDGSIGCAMIDWLADRITVFNPAAVWFEAPLAQQSSINAAQVALGLLMCVKVVCWRRSVLPRPGHVQTVRAQVLGNGRAKKPEVAAWCRAQGWDVPEVGGEDDLDASDAAALWAYATGIRAPGRRVAA